MGQEAFKSVVKSHYKGVAAVIFFYSIEKQETLSRLAVWVREVKDNVHEETVFFLVGTKLDLEDVRKVGKEEGEAYGKEIKAAFFQEISSKTGENVKEVPPGPCSSSTSWPSTSTRSINRPRATRNSSSPSSPLPSARLRVSSSSATTPSRRRTSRAAAAEAA
jgi:hypothetical protein